MTPVEHAQRRLRGRRKRPDDDVPADPLELLPDAVVTADASGEILSANPVAETLLRYSRDELVRLELRNLGLVGEAGTAERWLRRKDGSTVPAEVATAQLPDGGWVFSMRDITTRKQLEETRQVFLTAVSHETRTPLTIVRAVSATLRSKRDKLSETQTKELLDRLDSAAQRLERLLTGALDLDRLRRGVIEPIRRITDVVTLVHRVIENLPSSGRWFEIDGPDGLIVPLDAGQVERIVESLLMNVVRHTPAGTPAWVHIRREEDGVLIVVEDAGPGVPDEIKRSIFEPFSQGKVVDHEPGTGMGLAVVAQFAKLHGGRAWVQDRPGGGSSFRVYLPGK